MLKIIFVNFELGFDNNLQTLVGASNKFYGGPSRWNPKYRGQAIETEFAAELDFVRAMEDIARTYSLYARKWVPIPQFPEAPTVAELFDIKNLSDEELAEEVEFRANSKRSRDLIIADITRPPRLTIAETFGIVPEDGATNPLFRGEHSGIDNQTIADKPPTEITAATPFFALKSIAKKHGIDLAGCKTNAERAAKINEALAEFDNH